MNTRRSGLGPSAVAAIALLGSASPALAQADTAALRQQLEAQKKLIGEQARALEAQKSQLEKQGQLLEDLGRRLNAIETSSASDKAEPVTFPAASGDRVKRTAATADLSRDEVGDLNADAVRSGDFPGAFRIPGSGRVSLAIGGSVKVVGIFDSDAEAMGSDFLPATLGTSRPDKHGAASLDTTLTRIFIDGRAPVADGQVRGYVEYDLNAANNGSPDFKLRHAYGTWSMPAGTLTVGQTWSTLMDLAILPEGLTEPTVSGVIFNRQALMRWTGMISPKVKYHLAAEDPSGGDLVGVTGSRGLTSMPDLVASMELDPSKSVHFAVAGIIRQLKVTVPVSGKDTATASGVVATARFRPWRTEKLVLSGVYGEGLGRYFLGIRSDAGNAVNPADNKIDLRTNYGGMISYQHAWNESMRSTVMAGYAKSKPLSWQPAGTFDNSRYFSINLMKRILPYLTAGVEYGYGRSEYRTAPDIDNHRVSIGFQVF